MIAQRLQNKTWWEALRAASRELAESKPPRWLPFGVIAIPALLLFVQITHNWVNIPYWDEWGLIARLRLSLQSGTLRPHDLFDQHNDSRFLVPQLILLPLARVTHWDLRAEMFVIFATVCLISWVLWGLLGKIENLPRPARFGCLLVCNCLLFSPLQYETWLWGINLSLVLPPLFLLLALRVNLSALSLPAKVGLNILLCFASTFSNANGMGNWLLAFPAFVHGGARPDRRWFWYGVYLAAAIGTLLLFFWDYQSHASASPLLQSPALLLKYFFCLLGAPVAIALGTSAWIAGLCLSCLFLSLSGTALFRSASEQRRHAAYAFTAIGCYSGLAAAATAVGRVGLRFEWSLGSRYTTFSIYLPIAAIGLAALYFSRTDDRGNSATGIGPRRVIAALIVIAILAGSLATYGEGMKGMSRTRKERARGRAALLFSKVLPHNPNLKILCSNPAMMIGRYRELLRSDMARSPFVAPSSIPKLQPRPGMSRTGGYFRVCELKEDRLRMKGWALLEERGAAPFVLFADRTRGTEAVPFSVAPTRNESPKGAPHGVRDCGFEIKIEAPKLPEGRVEISAWA
ncbi:MAG TPA: hypothetical protein VH207_15220, partial [Chthoniobacterales bacterium]|nr:hypothetical protein [Chthoniobacterales bacterium]